MKTFLTILSLTLTVGLSGQDWDAVQIETTRVSDNVYMLKGSGGNIGVIVGEDGVLLVDDQYAPLADKIKTAIAAISDQPVRYIINTHWHGDHMGGNEVFAGDGSIIIAHDNVRTRISTDQFMSFHQREVKARPEIAWPIITFSQNLTYYFNDEEIHIRYTNPAHTDGDAVVFFKKANVIHMGDTFVRYGYPFVDNSAGGSITGMIENLDRTIELIDDDTKVIPGHGDLANKSDMVKFRDVLKEIVNGVKKGVDEGKSLDEIQNSKITEKFDPDYEGAFIKAKDFVTFVYEDLTK